MSDLDARLRVALGDLMVSKDKDIIAAAGDVLHGRYAGTRAMLWPEFWASCQ